MITTAGHHYPLAHGPERHAMFTAACKDGGVTLAGLGVSPGVIGERLAMTLASTSVDLEAVTIDEVLDASGMPSPDFVFTVMGMGSDPNETDLVSGPLPQLYRALYSETLAYLADHLGLHDYEIVDDHHVELATVDVDVRAGKIRAGTVVATEWRWHLLASGVRRLSLAIIWTMDPTLERYVGRPHWRVHMTGRPEVVMDLDLREPVDADVRTTAGQYITAGIVRQAIPVVVAAPPGVLSAPAFAPYRY